MTEQEVNLPDVQAEVKILFDRYETALINNDISELDKLFWSHSLTLRFGIDENIYGIDAIRAFRAARSPAGLARNLRNTVITSFGRDVATANTEFFRDSVTKCGRQSQTWIRFASGWKIVSAHVSIIDMLG